MRPWLPSIAVLAAATLAAVVTGSGPSAARASGVAASAGTWRVVPPSAPRAIEGYASQTSVAPGEQLDLHVGTTPAERYRIEIHRIGWYAGKGGRRIACLPRGVARPTSVGARARCPSPIVARARRVSTGRSPIASSCRQGGGAATTSRSSSSRPVLTLAGLQPCPSPCALPPPRVRPMLVVLPVNTWQQYNAWGGVSTYTDEAAAVKVSFDRPYEHGLNKPLLDYPVVRFVDQFDYDVGYVDRRRRRSRPVGPAAGPGWSSCRATASTGRSACATGSSAHATQG